MKKDYPSYQKDNELDKFGDWWMLPDDHPNYDKQVNSYIKLQKKIENDSVDWYFSNPKSDAAKRYYNSREKNGDKLLGIVLNDLGYENTKEGRDYIRNVVMNS